MVQHEPLALDCPHLDGSRMTASVPSAALGAVVFYAAGKLVSIPEFRRLWRFRRREFILVVITLVGRS
jgi:SulP family sulfate permease